MARGAGCRKLGAGLSPPLISIMAGLYAFGRQPEALHWNCRSVRCRAKRLLADTDPLGRCAFERFGPLYMEAIARRWCWRLGVEPQREPSWIQQLVSACEKAMRESGVQPGCILLRSPRWTRAS